MIRALAGLAMIGAALYGSDRDHRRAAKTAIRSADDALKRIKSSMGCKEAGQLLLESRDQITRAASEQSWIDFEFDPEIEELNHRWAFEWDGWSADCRRMDRRK